MVAGMRAVFAAHGVPAVVQQAGPIWQVFFGLEEPVTRVRQSGRERLRLLSALPEGVPGEGRVLPQRLARALVREHGPHAGRGRQEPRRDRRRRRGSSRSGWRACRARRRTDRPSGRRARLGRLTQGRTCPSRAAARRGRRPARTRGPRRRRRPAGSPPPPAQADRRPRRRGRRAASSPRPRRCHGAP